MTQRNEKWLWRAVAAAIYAAVFFVVLSVLDERMNADADEP
jgi:bacteriorhodopsin